MAPKLRSSDVGLTCRNTLRILNTIKPVTSAVTVMDTAIPITFSVAPQLGDERTWPGAKYKGAALPPIQRARGNE